MRNANNDIRLFNHDMRPACREPAAVGRYTNNDILLYTIAHYRSSSISIDF
jgi:hypothetical protein